MMGVLIAFAIALAGAVGALLTKLLGRRAEMQTPPPAQTEDQLRAAVHGEVEKDRQAAEEELEAMEPGELAKKWDRKYGEGD